MIFILLRIYVKEDGLSFIRKCFVHLSWTMMSFCGHCSDMVILIFSFSSLMAKSSISQSKYLAALGVSIHSNSFWLLLSIKISTSINSYETIHALNRHIAINSGITAEFPVATEASFTLATAFLAQNFILTHWDFIVLRYLYQNMQMPLTR